MRTLLKLDYPLNMNIKENLLLIFIAFLNIPLAFIMSLDINLLIGIGSGLLMILRNRAIIGVSIYEVVIFVFNRRRRKEIYRLWRAQLKRKTPTDTHKNDTENES